MRTAKRWGSNMASSVLMRENGSAKHRRAAISCDFANLPDLISNEGVPPENMETHRRIGQNMFKNNKWYGGLESIDDARSLILKGWTDGATKASAVTSQDGMISTLAQPESIRRRPMWAAEGDEVHCERAMNGEWDLAFRTMSRVRTYGSKIVSLASFFGGNCDKTSDQLFWSGAQLLVTAELLETAGYQCEIRGLQMGRYDNYSDAQSIVEFRVKEAGDPLRLDAVASIFAHAGTFRTYGLMAISRCPWEVTSSFGINVEGSAATTLFENCVADGLIQPCDVLMPHAFTKERAVENIVSAVLKVTEGQQEDA